MSELAEYAERIESLAKRLGLDYYPVDFEVAPASLMTEIAVYGLPIRMPHWSFGVRYIHQLVRQSMGHSKIFEVMFPGDPCRAFLMDQNSLAENTLVTAHVAVRTAAIEAGKPSERWARVAIASAKQCGRATVPQVLPPAAFADVAAFVAHLTLPGPALMLVEPSASAETATLADLPAPSRETTLLIGPEGGWTAEEIDREVETGLFVPCRRIAPIFRLHAKAFRKLGIDVDDRERCIERHRLCAGDLVLYVLVPVGNQLFAQLRSVRQQATERCARTSGGNKVVMTGCDVLTAVGVPDDLAELNPDIAGPKGMVVVLALVVIPYTLEALVVGKSGDVYPHVTSTREALDMLVLRRETVVGPLFNEAFPLVWRVDQ